ncbi:MAG: hypothetical protein ACRC50_03610 [Gaiella sp.]
MAEKTGSKDALGELATRGQETLHRLVELPGGTTALKAFNDLKLRVDDLAKKARGVDELEARVAKLEKEVAALRRAQKPTAQKAPSRKSAG